jgi:osmotically-inducible protein OsmY
MTHTLQDTDYRLKFAILAELAWAPSVRAENIGVAVLDGAVTLSGEVASYPEKVAALDAALRVSGVIAAADEVIVRHTSGPPADVDIAREAGHALKRAVNVPGTVKATVHQQVITLTGEAAWEFQRVAARHAVASLPGVTGVWSTVTLVPTSRLPAADAKAQIMAALVRNAVVDAGNIRVTVVDGKVMLRGNVSSSAERRQVQHAAWSCPGITAVDNELVNLS